MRKPFVAGNWKMNTTLGGAVALARDVAEACSEADYADVAVCPPFVYLKPVADALAGTRVALGAQDVYFEPEGAFTGEISPAMLLDVGCKYVIVGHSERRHVLGEGDELVAKKAYAAALAGLDVILCVGELLEERKAGKTEDVLARQLLSALEGFPNERLGQLTIAYEPVWAIGTGETATPCQAQEAHAFLRGLLANDFGEDIAEMLRIQYGGSVKPENAGELMAQPDVDGALVGGASLKTDSFAGIIRAGA